MTFKLSTVDLPDTRDVPARGRNLLSIGLLMLIAGMCLLPAGASLNPGKPYQYLLGLTLYLPALILGFQHPQRWRTLITRPLMPALLLLFAWALLSLTWSNANRPLDEILRLLTLLLFLFAWTHGVGTDPLRQRCLLVGGAAVIAITTLPAMLHFFLHPPSDQRLTGFGVMANANLMAAALGAGILWLWPWRFSKASHRLLMWLAMLLMVICLSLTHSRSAWVALFVAMFVLFIGHRKGPAWRRLCALVVIALGVAAALYPSLSQRGWSFRPEIFQHAWSLFLQHPWQGWGLGAHFVIPTQGMTQVHTHNLFTQLAVELGLPGLLLWCFIWLALGWRSWQARQHIPGRITLGLWAFATVMVQFDLPHLIDSPRPGWLIVWLPFALSLSLPSSSPDTPPTPAK